jgi:uncharacterized protein (TIGR00290 family)
MTERKKAFCSWSGGKDSCLALQRSLENDLKVTHLLTMFDETGERSRSHAVSREVMQAQADALKLKLIAPAASWQNHETVFVGELKKLKAGGIEIAVFGDIDLAAHREWEEKVCRAAGIEACLPLWNERRMDLVEEFFDRNFRAVVICVNEKFLGKEFCGREFDRKFVADLPDGVDACGENGEFHTFVYDGALFKNPVRFEIAEIYHHAPVFPSGDANSFYYAHLTV